MIRRKRTLLAIALLVVPAVAGLALVPLLTSPEHRINATGAALVSKGMTEAEVTKALAVPPGDYRQVPADGRQRDVVLKMSQEADLVLMLLKEESFIVGRSPVAEPTFKSWVSDWGVVDVVFDDERKVVLAIHSPFRDESYLACLRRWLGL
jgi:hypothetical protein